MEETVVLFRPVGQEELDLIRESSYSEFPPRLPDQPIFYPVTNEDYAIQIARDWNAKQAGVGYVTKFAVGKLFLEKYETHIVGGSGHEEFWIPAEDLEAFNRNIVGTIEVVHEFVVEK